jgi:hypothetical protein
MKWLHLDQPENSEKLGAGDSKGQGEKRSSAQVAHCPVKAMQKVQTAARQRLQPTRNTQDF